VIEKPVIAVIDKHALIDASAKIADNVSIGPFTVIGAGVEIGEGTWIGPHAVIKGPTKIGKNNKIFQFASIGEAAQDIRYNGEPTKLEIGDGNVFREFCTVHRGTVQGRGRTVIGNDNLFMSYTHVAHDCVVGNKTIFSNNASIAGHVTVGDYAYLGGMVGVHQHCAVGAHSFAAGGAIIFKDVPPFVTVSGYPAEAHGLNTVGLERRGYSPETIAALKRAYKVIFRQSFTTQEAIAELHNMIAATPEVKLLSDFLTHSTRGIVR
jgi:UDP-N-acetylglucosamine acyltransferase